MSRTKREQEIAKGLQKALWKAEQAAARKAAAYEHLIKAAMLVRERVPNVDVLFDTRGTSEATKRRRANAALLVLCRALDRLGRVGQRSTGARGPGRGSRDAGGQA